MITYNKILDLMREFSEAHFVLKNFGNGPASEIVIHNQEDKFIYPLMWIEDINIPVSGNQSTFVFRVYFISQVASLKKRADDLMSTNENEVKSDMVSCAHDIMAFWDKDTTFKDLVLVRSATILTFTDDLPDRVTGCFLDLQLKQGFRYDKCSIPMAGVTPPPPPAVNPIDIRLNGILMRANQTANVDIPVFKLGTTDPIGSGTEGNPFFVSVVGTDDLEKGTVVAGVVEIADSSITANGDALKDVVSEAGFDVEILDSVTLDPADTSIVGDKVHVVTGGGATTIAYCYPRTRQTDVFQGETLGQGQLFLDGVYSTSLVGVAPVLDNDHPYYKLDITTAGTLPNKDGNEFIWTGRDGGYIDEFDVFHLLNDAVTTRALAFPDGIAFNNYNGLDYPIDTVSSTGRSQLDSESFVDTLTFGGFSDWRVCHPGEADAMGQFNNANAFNNVLFLYANTNHWTNETAPNNPAQGRFYNMPDGSTLRRQAKTSTARLFMCRTHTFP